MTPPFPVGSSIFMNNIDSGGIFDSFCLFGLETNSAHFVLDIRLGEATWGRYICVSLHMTYAFSVECYPHWLIAKNTFVIFFLLYLGHTPYNHLF